ncbi:phosphoprotein phosphatase-like protein [Leishmania mexicana MHOM/GT/2001/U1103]|uniref:Phosphoprotein phosphatase-like protein n=1 Tax=Leishmania mexicana (strain MHOM/GT/2001/U1103) TaxID=929439 RepID=E9API1_LEIMU|nr:phosphoprotein phosphatase-like protein [Leishmania mexicana MHOM/GT/2001/U1103]CBZ24845.1 phosphoprotein phosphatase-like protein [Leishmania mexicana MHOM/GT/2001/U1103]
MEASLPFVISHQAKEGGGDSLSKVHVLRPACFETLTITSSARSTTAAGKGSSNTNGNTSPNVARVLTESVEHYLADRSPHIHGINSPLFPTYSSNKPTTNPCATPSGCLGVPVSSAPQEAVPTVNSPLVSTTSASSHLKASSRLSNISTGSCHVDGVDSWATSNCLLQTLDNPGKGISPLVLAPGKSPQGCGASPRLRISESSSTIADDLENDKPLRSSTEKGSGEKRFFGAPPRSGKFLPLIEWLLRRGERGDVGALTASQKDSDEHTQASFFNEDYILKLCAAATTVLVEEPALLELEVIAHDTLVVVGDIHGQFQDLYTSVLCQQYDRRRCNPEGRDHRFLFMGDYVDRGPHSLEVMLLLLALKVEYPTLVYLTRGNHEEEKTSRVYGFLTEVTTSLGAAAGTAVWSAVNKVFLDLPLAAIVQTLYMRFFVTHGGLSPGLQSVEEIASIDRHNYSSGNVTAAEDDLITGLLWSDPTNEMAMYKQNPRGCGFLFGPSASNRFCADNNFDFICRAHQVAMDGYFWTHNDRVVTVFSAPNYCGINNNRGAVMVVSGEANKPSFEQYDCCDERDFPSLDSCFLHASFFY